ncbi:hypothetical protein, partial [Stenotrophomonas sp. PD6]|uniref:hypothetical protein n=1 Tax=Stenotrophomonas sp. PD6 TaxID=3368612 RepID=UPI003BA2EFD1
DPQICGGAKENATWAPRWGATCLDHFNALSGESNHRRVAVGNKLAAPNLSMYGKERGRFRR